MSGYINTLGGPFTVSLPTDTYVARPQRSSQGKLVLAFGNPGEDKSIELVIRAKQARDLATAILHYLDVDHSVEEQEARF